MKSASTDSMKRERISDALSGMIDLIVAGLLWLVCSIPVITLGASTTALYYAVNKCVRHNRGRLTPTFFSGFRSNFRQATIIWLIVLAYALIGVADAYAFQKMGHGPGSVLYTLSQLFFAPLLLYFPWVFAFLSRFDNTVGGTLKFCGWLTLRYFGRSLLLAVELAVFLLIVWLLPTLLPLLPAAFCLMMSLSIEPVFKTLQQNYPNEDVDAWYNE